MLVYTVGYVEQGKRDIKKEWHTYLATLARTCLRDQ